MPVKGLALLVTITAIFMATFSPTRNGPPPEPSVTIQVQNGSDDIALIEILIQQTTSIDEISKPNTRRPELLTSDLVGYNDDGFVSFSLYFHGDVKSIQKTNVNTFKIRSFNSRIFSKIKIVALDRDGHILQITDAINLSADDAFHQIGNPSVVYDYSTNQVKVNIVSASLLSIIINSLLFGGARIIISLLIEVLIALFARIKPIKVVIITNLITQGIITAGLPFLAHATSYLFALVIFELAVVAIEYAAYSACIHDTKKVKLLLYTVGANAASLVIIFLLNLYGVFTG